MGKEKIPIMNAISDEPALASLRIERYEWKWRAIPMPRIFEKDGFSFFFYSNDHRPIHVHVRYGGAEAVFDVEGAIELRESNGFKVKELSRAEDLIRENQDLIREKWNEHNG
jgi:hypothetical protein